MVWEVREDLLVRSDRFIKSVRMSSHVSSVTTQRPASSVSKLAFIAERRAESNDI
jgi:hypothetical protein